MKPIEMVDLHGQYLKIKPEIDRVIGEVIAGSSFINGPSVSQFNQSLAAYHEVEFAQGCGNGTDALQIALMALELKAGDEVIMPAFTYFATVEVVLLLGLSPIFIDVDPNTFCVDVDKIREKITSSTRVILPVHLFGHSADMEAILKIADEHNLNIVEDNAQSIGGSVEFSNGQTHKNGSLGDISCTSFFPSKNLGCFGDGGSILTSNEHLAKRIKMIANHGQEKKYFHDIVGLNSRLDSVQAAVLNVKLKHLDEYNEARKQVASAYNAALSSCEKIKTPFTKKGVNHVFHQYTIQLDASLDREKIKANLRADGIPTMIYYPIACHQQKAYLDQNPTKQQFPVSERLSQQVLSLPIHTEMTEEQIDFIVERVKLYCQ